VAAGSTRLVRRAYSGSIVLDTPVVRRRADATAPAGGTAGADFTLTNAGHRPAAYVESQRPATARRSTTTSPRPVTGTLTGTIDGISPSSPSPCRRTSPGPARATWTSADPTPRRPGLYDPARPTRPRTRHNDQGNASRWSLRWPSVDLILGYGDPALPADAAYTVNVDYVARRRSPALPRRARSACRWWSHPRQRTIHVTIDVPADASPAT